MSEETSWETITADNKDPIEPLMAMLEKSATSDSIKTKKKRGRGRPPKPVSAEPTPPGTPLKLEPQELELQEAATPESFIPTPELVNLFMKEPSPRQKRSSLRFSGEEESGPTPEKSDPDRLTLLRMYSQYFREPLASKHQKRQKTFTTRDTNADIVHEIKELESLCANNDPATILGNLWIASLSGFEAFGPAVGWQTQGLSIVASTLAKTEDFQSNMRELLIKYPSLRVMLALGGYPELKLFLMTASIIKMVHETNVENGAGILIPPNKEVPSHINNAPNSTK